MNRMIGAVAAALLLAVGAGFSGAVAEEPDASTESKLELASCPPNASTITLDCAVELCAAVTESKDRDLTEQALIGREAAALIRDYGESDAANAGVITACVANGPDAVFAAYNGNEVAQVGEGVPASEQ